MRSFKISVVKILMVLFAMLMLGTTTFAQASVTLPTVSGISGDVKTGNITVTNLPASTNAYQFTLSYNKAVVYITGVDDVGTLSAGFTPPVLVNADTANGKISVAFASGTPLSGTSGTLLKLVFKFRNAGNTAITLFTGTDFLINTTPAIVAPGSANTPAIGITVATVSSTPLNTDFYIPINTTVLTTANNIFSFNFTATFDVTKIQIVGLGYETAPAGLPVALTNNTSQPQINFSNTTGTVSFAWANGASISGAGTLVYLKARAISRGTSTVALTSFMFNAGVPTAATFNGTVTAVNSAPVFGANNLTLSIAENATLAFTLVASDIDGDALTYSFSSSPTITGQTFNTSSGAFSWIPSYTSAGVYTFTFGVTDGTASALPLDVTVVVTDVNRAPTLAFQTGGPLYTVAENQPMTITLVGSDVDTDNTLKYTMTTTPATIAGVNLSTAGVFTWTPTFAQSGSYTIVFKVEDYKGITALGGSATKTATITVSNTNRAPVFTSVIPSGVIVPVHRAPNPVYYNFQYAGNDPDGQPVAYSLIAAPTGASITINGLFSWAPTEAQAGSSYVVTVQITDGQLTAQSTVIITASSTITDVDEYSGIPTEYVLMQNYPNPFNPTTSIRFGLPTESNVRLSVFNILGQEVAVLLNQTMSAEIGRAHV